MDDSHFLPSGPPNIGNSCPQSCLLNSLSLIFNMDFLAAMETPQILGRVDVQMLLVLWRREKLPKKWWINALTSWAKVLYPLDPNMDPQKVQGSLYEAFAEMLAELQTCSSDEKQFIKNFTIQSRSRVICDKCQAESQLSSESDPFISVEFNAQFPENDENGVNIVELLEKQDLTASDWKCPSRCESFKTQIANHYSGLPKVLLILLKRLFPMNFVSREDSASGAGLVMGRHKHRVTFGQRLILTDTSEGKLFQVTYQLLMSHYHGIGVREDEPFSEGHNSYSVTGSGHYFTFIHNSDGSLVVRSDDNDYKQPPGQTYSSFQRLQQSFGRKVVALQYEEIGRQEILYPSPPSQPQPPSTTLNHPQPHSSSTLQPASTNLPHPVTPQAKSRRLIREVFMQKLQDSGNSSSCASPGKATFAQAAASPARATTAATDRPRAAANPLGHLPEVTHGSKYDGSPDQAYDDSPDEVCRQLFPFPPPESTEWV